MRRVRFEPGEIRVRVRNPQPQALTVALVTVDDAIVPFTLDGPHTLGRLRSTTIVVPYAWIEGDPYTVGITSSTGIQTVHEIAAAVPARGATFGGVAGYALIGLLVGVVPVALGPRLAAAPAPRGRPLAGRLHGADGGPADVPRRRRDGRGARAAGGPAGGVRRRRAGPARGRGQLPRAGWLSRWLTRRAATATARRRCPTGLALATLVAVGIGVHNLGEGLAIGSSFALGELALGTFLVIGFMVHNVTEGLGIAAPLAAGGARPRGLRLIALAVVAGAPAILGAWIGGFLTNDVLAVLFFGLAAGAALQVVVEVGRYLQRRAPGGLASGPRWAASWPASPSCT